MEYNKHGQNVFENENCNEVIMGMGAVNIILSQQYCSDDTADHRIYDSSFSGPTVPIID